MTRLLERDTLAIFLEWSTMAVVKEVLKRFTILEGTARDSSRVGVKCIRKECQLIERCDGHGGDVSGNGEV